MRSRLAIYAPLLGAPSETFVRRHMCDLLRGETVVIVERAHPEATWTVDVPILFLQTVDDTREFAENARNRLRQVQGKPPLGRRDEVVRRFLRQHGVEVMMGEYLDGTLGWIDLAERMGIRLYARALGYDMSRNLRDPAWREAYLRYNRVDRVIPNSHSGMQGLVAIGIDRAKMRVVPCGVDVPADAPLRTNHPEVRCLAVGRMVAKKAPILTLDAFRRAREARPNMRLDYVGSGELLPAARQYVEAFGLADFVRLHGTLPAQTVEQLLQEADIFIQHSVVDPETGDEEGLPVVILQAMAQGLPVVSTTHAGIPEAVVEGVTGYLVPEGDSAGMADRIVTLAGNRQLRIDLGLAAWQRAQTHFSWELEREGLLEIMGLQAGVRANARR